MKYQIAFLESQFEALQHHLFGQDGSEQAAFLLARQVTTAESVRWLVRKVIPVELPDVISSSNVHMSIASRAYLRAMKEADSTRSCFIFVHSHPNGLQEFSKQDDSEEGALFQTAYTRIHHELLHASLVFADRSNFRGRVWFSNNTQYPIETIKVIGRRFRPIYSERPRDAPLEYFDRQARAFTAEIQPVLKRLHLGVVGVGGTGSAVCEQLIRLGIGEITVIDAGSFENSNVNRVYGSCVFDQGNPKVNIAGRLATTIGLGTQVNNVVGHLSSTSVCRQLLECDLVFGCTDDEWGRSILNRLSWWYYIPVLDMGVSIDSADGEIRSVNGRVTCLLPGNACLYCRKRISSERVRAEALAITQPEEAEKLRKEGYLSGIHETAPSVITFTSAIASAAVSEFLQMLTGFKGTERTATEILYLFEADRVRSNSTPSSADCICANASMWGQGDTPRFLDLNLRA